MDNDLKNKLLQMFIVGYKGLTPDKTFYDFVQNGLGGIIFFAENLKNREDFKKQISSFKNLAKTPLFLSVDQEGGLVERTIFLDKKVEYLTSKAISRLEDENDIKEYYKILCEDLSDLGLNFNFAPVLDVNSNSKNPIIGVRSYGNTPEIVNKYSTYAIKIFKENNIISCGKHFAGHGDTSVDSHLNMPCVNMEFEEFYKKHLICFIKAIENEIDTIMVSHVYFSFLNELKTPATLSENAVEIFFKSILKYNGLVISDDMVMGGVSKYYGLKESIILAIKAGIDVMLFRDLSDDLVSAIDEVVKEAQSDEVLKNKISSAYDKILKFKNEKIKNTKTDNFDTEKAQKNIDNIAKKTIKIYKNSLFLNEYPDKKIKIISFDNKEIFNLSYMDKSLQDYMNSKSVETIYYTFNPQFDDIEKILSQIDKDETVIFLSYNAQINTGQIELFNKIENKKILISMALDDDIELFNDAEMVISTACYKTPILKALAELLI